MLYCLGDSSNDNDNNKLPEQTFPTDWAWASGNLGSDALGLLSELQSADVFISFLIRSSASSILLAWPWWVTFFGRPIILTDLLDFNLFFSLGCGLSGSLILGTADWLPGPPEIKCKKKYHNTTINAITYYDVCLSISQYNNQCYNYDMVHQWLHCSADLEIKLFKINVLYVRDHQNVSSNGWD